MSKGMDPDQNRHFVGPGLGPNCLQRFSTSGKSSLSKERVKIEIVDALGRP